MNLQTTRYTILAGLLFWLSAGQSFPQAAQGTVDYQSQVQSVLANRCAVCHGQELREGGLSVSTYGGILAGGRSGAAIRPGKSDGSLLMHRITGEIQPRMPIGGKPLSDSEIALIRLWIDEGARQTPTAAPATPKWEPLLSLARPEVPAVVWKDWASPLDRLVAAYLAKSSATEPQSVSDAQFARRAYLDIWGLLPEPADLRAFVGERSADKREKLVHRLLADPEKYAEHWISFWNDLLRNDEGVTYHAETASRKSISEWLLASLKSNLPYDQFVSKLLNPTVATDPEGFLIGVNWRGTISASQTPAMQAAQNTAQIFIGVNLKCNSCHDSFVSRWKLKQAYSMASYFSAEDKLQLYRCDVAQNEYASPAFLYPELDRTPVSSSTQDRRATAAAVFTDKRNGRLARTLVNRLWQRLLGHGLVDDPDDMDGEPWEPAVLDWLASDFVDHGYDIKHLIGTIVASRAYQLPSVKRGQEQPKQYIFRGPEIRRMSAEQFADAIGGITGEWQVNEKGTGPADGARPAAQSPPPDRNQSGAAHSGVGDPGIAGAAAARTRAVAGGERSGPVASTNAANPSARVIPVSAAARTTDGAALAAYTRDWHAPASPLTRALGRPIRDQVYSTRDTQATTLQAIELVNGEVLTRWLARGARRMLGQLPPEPVSIFDHSFRNRGEQASFDVDISGAERLWLLVQDAGSYSPERVEAVWSGVTLVGPGGATPLSTLKPLDVAGIRGESSGANRNKADVVRAKTPSRLVYDLRGKGYVRLRGSVGLENAEIANDIMPQLRFFIFREEPNMDRLTPVAPATPIVAGPPLKSSAEVVDRLFWYALGRDASPDERRIAEAALDPAHSGRPSAEGLADLLWAVVMKPEFQLIY